MTSVCSNGRKQKKGGDDDDDDTANADFNATRFLTVTYNENTDEISAYENVLSAKDVHTMLEDSHQGSKNKLQRMFKHLATSATSMQPTRGRKGKNKHHLNLEQADYRCTFCDKLFTRKQSLRRHMKLHTADISRKMSEALDKKSEQRKEMQTHGGLKKVPYICEICGIDCKYKAHYIEHQNIHIKKEKNLHSCHICSKEFKFNSLLLHHAESHKPKSKAAKALSCQTCGKKYSKTGSLTKHELQHEGKGSFRCRPCGRVFGTEVERTKHRDEKHKKPWKCPTCSHMFATEQKLDSHVRWHESKETEVFVCNVCGKEFKLKVNLKVHVESRCGTDPQHVCNVCGKAFMTRGTLVTHSLLHTGEKTFLCRFCGKNFRLKVEMQRHERSHTGEKPFVCKVCNKAFAHRESLVTHNTLHTGIRPYMCEACGSTFSCIGNLIKHRKTHRNRCALVTPAMTSSKLRVKPTSSHLKLYVKNLSKTKPPIEKSMNRAVSGQRPSDNEEPPGFLGGCYSYTNSNYDRNHDWTSPVISSSDQTIEQTPVTNDRSHSVADLRLGCMERNLKSAQYYWGSGLHADSVQPFGVYTAVCKESTRSLPYPGSTEGLVLNNENPTVGNFFQNVDNHRLQSYGTDKHSHDYRSLNACNGQNMAADSYQQSNSKSLCLVTQNMVSTQREPDSVCVSRTAALVNGLESTCHYMTAESEDCVSSHSTGENSVKNMKSEDADNKHSKDDLSDTVHEETGELSEGRSPVTNSSDSELSDREEADIFASKVQTDCNNIIRKKMLVEMSKSKQDDVKAAFGSEVVMSVKKTPRERKQKYPVRCDIKSEEPKATLISRSTSDHEDQFLCVLCGLGFAQEQLLNEHTRSHSDSSNETDRVSREKTGPTSEEDEPLHRRLQRHLRKADIFNSETVPGKFLCQYCNKYFEFVSQLNRHRKCHSSDDKEATPCRHCGKKYTNRACLIKHESQHTGSGVFKCKQCDDGFNSKQEYRSHRAKQHGKQWSCSECQRSFSNSSNLKNHYNNKHLGCEAKSYACNICGKLFKQKGNLKVHVDSRCGSEPRHVCSICGKAFMSGGSLGTHSLLHTGEKTFLCRFCGKNFRLKVEMQRHERSHTGEKPFVCKVCNKAFAHRESLVTHNTLHTGIRPYMCEACGSTFSCIGNLIKHRQTHNRRCDIVRQ